MKILKVLIICGFIASSASRAVAQVNTANDVLKQHVIQLQQQTLATLIVASYMAKNIEIYKVPSVGYIRESLPDSIQYVAVSLGSSQLILGFGSIFNGFGGSLLAMSDSAQALSSVGGMVVLSAALPATPMSADFLTAELEDQNNELVVAKLVEDHKFDERLTQVLSPWIKVMSLDASQSARLKVKVKSDLIAQIRQRHQNRPGGRNQKLQTPYVNIIGAAKQAGIIDEKTAASAQEVLKKFETGIQQASTSARSVEGVSTMDILMAENLVAQLKIVLSSQSLTSEDQSRLKNSVVKLEKEIMMAKEVQQLISQ